jgi:hypothetical protein
VSLTRKINEIRALSSVPKLSRTFRYSFFRVAELPPAALPTCQFFSFPIVPCCRLLSKHRLKGENLANLGLTSILLRSTLLREA